MISVPPRTTPHGPPITMATSDRHARSLCVCVCVCVCVKYRDEEDMINNIYQRIP